MKTVELFAPSALQPFIAYCTKRNISVESYLERYHIPSELIYTGNGMILKNQAYHFFSDIAQLEGLPTFGLLDGDNFIIQDLGLLGEAVQQAATLKDAISTFIALLPSVAEGNKVWLRQGKELCWLYCRTYKLGRTDYVPDQTSILALRALIRLAAGSDWQPPKIDFFTLHVPAIDSFHEWSDTEVNFSRPLTGIAFPTHFLSTPLAQSSYSGSEWPVSGIKPTTTSKKLQTCLHSLYCHRYPVSLDQVCELLGSSRVTLYRTLAKEGVNFRQIVERVRYRIAVDLLQNSSLSIQEIAHELNYSTTGNFSRAFFRMSGLTPSAYREKTYPDPALCPGQPDHQ